METTPSPANSANRIDLTRLEVRYCGRPMGTAVPHRIGRHRDDLAPLEHDPGVFDASARRPRPELVVGGVGHVGFDGAAAEGALADGFQGLAALPDVDRHGDDLGAGGFTDPADGY